MNIFERLFHWLSGFFHGKDIDYRIPAFDVATKKAVLDSIDPRKVRKVSVHIDTDEDIPALKAKVSDVLKEQKPKPARKKTEGKAATKAKPIRDASGKFAKKPQNATTK